MLNYTHARAARAIRVHLYWGRRRKRSNRMEIERIFHFPLFVLCTQSFALFWSLYVIVAVRFPSERAPRNHPLMRMMKSCRSDKKKARTVNFCFLLQISTLFVENLNPPLRSRALSGVTALLHQDLVRLRSSRAEIDKI